MKKEAKPISLKRQLMSAVSMMLAAAVALGSSTYAWFVNRSRAEVRDVLSQATAGKNLEIAAAVADGTKSTADVYGVSDGQQIPNDKADALTYYSTVDPTILGVKSFSYPKYSKEGTENYMTPVSVDSADLNVIGAKATFFKAKTWSPDVSSDVNGAYNEFSKVTGIDGKEYICAQLYFRASEAMDVYLNQAEWQSSYKTDTNMTDTSEVNIPFITRYYESGEDDVHKKEFQQEAKDLAKALRIAFVPGEITSGTDGTTTTADIKAAKFTGDSDNVTGAAWNTADAGDSNAITEDKPIKSIDDSSSKIQSFGTNPDKKIDDFALLNAPTGSSSSATDMQEQIGSKTALFTLEANKPKRITIYIWLEGTDKDCVSVLSNYRAGVYLPFVGVIKGGSDNGMAYDLGGDGPEIFDDDRPKRDKDDEPSIVEPEPEDNTDDEDREPAVEPDQETEPETETEPEPEEETEQQVEPPEPQVEPGGIEGPSIG